MKTNALLMLLLLAASCQNKRVDVPQLSIDRVVAMPDAPVPYHLIDWKEKALAWDAYVFDTTLTGAHRPFFWIDKTHRNFPLDAIGLYTVIGDVRQGPKNGKEFHEALCTMGSLLTAGLMGINKTKVNGRSHVQMVQNYFNRSTGWNIMMNNTSPIVAQLGGGYGRDWWYDVFPNVLYYAVCELYPGVPTADSLQHIIAEQFYKADSALNGNYDYSYFDYGQMKGMSNHIPHQQDAAAGHAWVLLCAYEKFGDARYLKGSISAMNAFVGQKESRFYEVLMPFGACVAARLNAEHGTSYDVKKILDWTFDGCKAQNGRTGWGVIAERWGDYDVHGLQGSITDNGGYAFLMNSFDLAWPLVPMVRYDPRFAVATGKWMLNVTNAARLFYPDEIDDAHQWLPEQKEITHHVIAYEGLRKVDTYGKKELKGKSPVALGDGPLWVKGQPETSMFSLYSSAQVGIFGALVRKTDVERILQINCNATDFYAQKSFPTFLYYNPYDEVKSVTFETSGDGLTDVYDVLSHTYVLKGVAAKGAVEISAKAARLLVVLPAGTPLTEKDGEIWANERIIAFRPPVGQVLRLN